MLSARCLRAIAFAAAFAGADGVAALTLSLPEGAQQTASQTQRGVRATFPASRWSDGSGATETAEGTLIRTAWRLDASGRTSLQLLAPLREQMRAAGYEIHLQCAARSCGGFDFRFATNALDAPRMYVDLADYQYLLGRKDGEWASLLVSRAGATGFVQLTRLIPTQADPAPVAPPEPTPPETSTLWQELERNGHAPLDDLVFASGSAALDGRRFASLETLAARLDGNPDLRLTLVGHTDSEGDLAANIALSRRRAEAVRAALAERHGVDPQRIGVEGVGPLAPRATNATAAGRAANRRVEVTAL